MEEEGEPLIANVRAAAERALEFVEEGMVVGLGSGRAAEAFLRALAKRVRNGMRVRGVPTSRRTEDLARALGITLTTLTKAGAVDVAVDGADEVDPGLDLIKGYGGAMLREKIVAASATRRVIVVDEAKLVPVLGTRGRLPIEVVPLGLPLYQRRLNDLGYSAALKSAGSSRCVTDNGNYILECAVSPISDPQALEDGLRAIPGVVASGLFIAMADVVLIQSGDTVQIRLRSD
jgi:ribose 5-phosphate isomerase A